MIHRSGRVPAKGAGMPGLWGLVLLAVMAACQADREEHPSQELTQVWTWMSGSQSRSQAGVYGTKGIAAPANVPGARFLAMSWSDAGGKLWIFGGIGYNAAGQETDLNDLWKYDPVSDQWTWVSGSPEGCQPGSYGTKGVAASTNVPGSRYGAVTWTDSGGRLWLFGGVGIAVEGESGELNDLWRFDPATSLWTWIGGGDRLYQLGVYGTKGVAAPDNVPGARSEAASWADPQGRLWLFGGRGFNAAEPVNVDLNDLWRFDPATLVWTWVHGGDAGGQAGVYGTKGLASPFNSPGSRRSAVSWRDPQGQFWLFGGIGFNSAGYESDLNDLWRLDPATLEWAWISGSDIGGQAGVYGQKRTAAATNVPGAHTSSVSCVGSQGTLWLFGGGGLDAAGDWGILNDLWRYTR